MTAAAKPTRSPALNMGPGDISYVDETDPVTVLGMFWPGKNTIEEVLAAATAVERLGYVPEIRFSSSGNDPECLELVTKDVPAMIGKLRASLTSTTNKEARTAETKRAFASDTSGASELHQ